jgi:hypothetical protein
MSRRRISAPRFSWVVGLWLFLLLVHVQLWQVYSNRVVVRPAAAPPAAISPIIDPAWLLSGYRLSVAGAGEYDGRPSLRLTAVPTGNPWSPKGPLSGRPSAADRIEADIDAELGIVVRQAWHYRGRHVLSAELADVTIDVDPAAFTIRPPARRRGHLRRPPGRARHHGRADRLGSRQRCRPDGRRIRHPLAEPVPALSGNGRQSRSAAAARSSAPWACRCAAAG